MFGVEAPSTGNVFNYHGRTFRDDDTAPEGDRRIDVYDPSNIERFARGGIVRRPLGMLARTASALGASVGARGGTNISYSPVITINATGDVAQAVKQAMRESHGDLIRRMKRAERGDFRRAIV